MRIRKSVVTVAAGVSLAVGAAAVPALAAGNSGTAGAGKPPAAGVVKGQLGERVTGTWTDKAGRSGKVIGTITPTEFSVAEDGETLLMTADVALRGTGAGAPRGEVTESVTVPVQGMSVEDRVAGVTGAGTLASGVACDVLNLDLGPLDLNLLGLQIDLQPVVLDITAVPGAGNLLGNLLCAVAGLLDGGGLIAGLVQQIADLLNQILGLLNGATSATSTSSLI